MFRYIAKRLLIFIPTFLVITLVTFYISVHTPGDPVENMLTYRSAAGESLLTGRMATEKAYREKRHQLGLDLPVFYFSISTRAMPDTLYRVPRKETRQTLKKLVYRYGNWQEISGYYHALRALEKTVWAAAIDSANAPALITIREAVTAWMKATRENGIRLCHDTITAVCRELASLRPVAEAAAHALRAFQTVQQQATPWKNYIPAIHFYGTANQYHRWLFGDGKHSKGFLRGDFGISYKTQRPVSSEIRDAVKWTLMLSLLAILITYLIAVPLGIYTAVHKGTWIDQAVNTFLFMLYSLPSFWVGIMLIVFFGGGDFFNWFPPYGVGEITPGMSWLDIIGIRLQHMVMPLVCLTYPTFAFLSRQARGGILDVLSQDYIRTARAKGLSEGKVIWKHGFRNALLPVITLFANVFPYAITGSFIVETVFSIPGMGQLTLDALADRNYPVVYTIVTLAAAMTMIGYLVADILYALADPRISYQRKKN